MAAQQTTEKVTGAAPSTKTGPSTTGSKVGKRAANGSHARTGTASDPPHICGICSKCFDRSKSLFLVQYADVLVRDINAQVLSVIGLPH